MTSMVVIALSTRRLSEMIRAPSEIRWRSMCIDSMIGNTIAIVSGMVSATTEPGLQAEADDAHRHDDGDRLPERFHEFADGGFDDDRLIGHQRRVDAERQVGDALVDRLLHVAAERQNVAAVAHGDGEADGGLAVDAKHRLRRIGIGAANLGDVAQPDQPPVRQEVDVENVRLRTRRRRTPATTASRLRSEARRRD